MNSINYQPVSYFALNFKLLADFGNTDIIWLFLVLVNRTVARLRSFMVIILNTGATVHN